MDSKKRMKEFLNDFWWAWYAIEGPAKLLEKYFFISEEWVVGLKLEWDMLLYIWSISDISLDDVQNVANSIKVLVNNYLKKDAEEDFWWSKTRHNGRRSNWK